MMNKEKILEELNKWAKSEFGSTFEVAIDCNDLTLFADAVCVAWFVKFKKDMFHFAGTNDCNLNHRLIKEGIVEKFYDKAIELLNEYESKKYTVQVFPQGRGYLRVNYGTSDDIYYDIDSPEDIYYLVKTQFTQSEIEELKKRDIAIDWDKAIIKEVKE